MKKLSLASITATLMLSLSACGGSSGGAASPPGPPPPPPPPPPPVVTTSDAFQLLNQATFGATQAEAQQVIAMGIAGWIDDQMQKPASLQLPYLRSLPPPQFPFQLHSDRVDIWFRNAMNEEDQLRQRVAFALSEILVVSQIGGLTNAPFSVGDYYDQLALHAFGNYRDLMEAVTLHPAMGVYLSMLGNQKPDPVLNIRPDENYARELMQLFTIGLIELNIDGSPKLDPQNNPIPTYDQSIIEGFAHVNTGWNYFFPGNVAFEDARRTDDNQTIPMELYPDFHDTGPKTVLNSVTIPAGQTGEQDLEMALDNVFEHDNVGPFLAYRLIQRLVTSNPSPGYIQRVATVFNNNGSGVRGDLGAVVRAILLDDEARPDMPMEIDGKIKEPLLRLTQLWRAYNAQSQSGAFPLVGSSLIFGQGPGQSPSVFNFFSPFYAPAGEIRNSGLVAPELEIATEYQNTFVTSYFFLVTFGWHSENPNLAPDNVAIDISEEIAIADDTDALIDMVADKLLAGDMSATLRTEIAGMVNMIDISEAVLRTAETIFLVVSSPEFAYQK